MDMGVNVKVVLGSVAVCGVLLLAGCGGSSSATAESGWNPPRPTGVPDEKWATVVEADPASLPVEDLAGGYCQAVKPEPADVDAKALEYPGATVEEFNSYYDYVIAYVAPLCADLPPAMQVKGIHKRGARQSSDL
jgi:hypothetical protein